MKLFSSFVWNPPTPPTLIPPAHGCPRLLWGVAPSYTTPFPTGQNLKEDQLGLEERHSHFQPNLQYVDPDTEVTQLRASPFWGFSLSYSWVSPPHLWLYPTSAPLHLSLSSPAQLSEARGGKISCSVRMGSSRPPHHAPSGFRQERAGVPTTGIPGWLRRNRHQIPKLHVSNLRWPELVRGSPPED